MTISVDLPRVPRSVPEWHERGACRLFPELDFVDARPSTPEALACRTICSVCPVRVECAVGALERRERWGIWGGLDYRDRKAVAREHGYEMPGDPPEHGTNSRRVKWGCTCADCRRAHAVYEFDRRGRARTAARRRDAWSSPLLVLVRPVRVGRARLCPGQLLLPLDLPAHRRAAPVESPALAAA